MIYREAADLIFSRSGHRVGDEDHFVPVISEFLYKRRGPTSYHQWPRDGKGGIWLTHRPKSSFAVNSVGELNDLFSALNGVRKSPSKDLLQRVKYLVSKLRPTHFTITTPNYQG